MRLTLLARIYFEVINCPGIPQKANSLISYSPDYAPTFYFPTLNRFDAEPTSDSEVTSL